MTFWQRMRPAQALLFAIVLLAPSCTQAQPPAGYYDSAEGLAGEPLKAALHNIIKDHTALTYGALWNAFATTDAKPGSKVWDIYSDIPGGTPPYVYTLFTNQCGSYSSEGDCYNREHSFPKSWFNSAAPMVTDLFHIYPTDGYVNQKRGDLAYGKVGSADWTSQNGSKTGLCISPGYNATVFEPIDAYKGDLARSYFYMMTRYYGGINSWSSPMLSGGDLAPWAVAVLLQWNDLDPVSPKETARNNAIFALQHNRNPFIDRPEWVHAIWGGTVGVQAQEAPALEVITDASGIEVERATSGPGTLLVRDASGRTVLRAPLSAAREHITFSSAKGVYIAEVTGSGSRMVKRFTW